MTYNVLLSGSKGNAVVINGTILIDCGVPFKALRDVYKDLQLVLLSHCHSDHFNRTAIKKLAQERPTLRFGCCNWLVSDLVNCGVSKTKIDIYDLDSFVSAYGYGGFNVLPFRLFHNAPNCGYKIHFFNDAHRFTEAMIYATDTNGMDGIEAKNYDLYIEHL